MAAKSKLPGVELPKENLVDYLFEQDLQPDKPAYIDAATGKTHTFGQLKDAIYACAGALRLRGFHAKNMALICSSNTIDYPVAFLGVLKAGGAVTVCNPLCNSEQLLGCMMDSEPVVMFTEMAFLATAQEAARQYKNIKDIIIFDGDQENCVSFEKLLQEAKPADIINQSVPIDINDICILSYTSGTTGIPKGVCHSHKAFTAGVSLIRTDDVGLCIIPLSHSIGHIIYICLSIKAGITVVLLKQFIPDVFLKAIVDYNVSSLFIVPPIADLLAKHPLVDNFKINSVKTIVSSGSHLPVRVMDMVKARLHVEDFRQSYGLTEGMACSATRSDNRLEGAVGNPLPQTEIRIVSLKKRKKCDFKVNGEILIRGPQVMMGYSKKPELTAQTIDTDGWLHTGDFGHIDKQGNLFLVDRVKDLIKYKDHQVVPSELESLLSRHESVQDAVVVGVPDPATGELPRAYVVLRPGVVESADMAYELEVHVAKHVLSHKRLRGGVQFIASVPRSLTGQILRRVIRSQALQEVAKTTGN